MSNEPQDSATHEPKPSETLIATLDLLGVTNMMCHASKTSDLSDIYHSIKTIYRDIETRAKTILQGVPAKAADLGYNRNVVQQIADTILNAIHISFFSDTIVIHLRLDEIKNDEPGTYHSTKRLAIGFFFGYVKMVTYTLMAKGFPARGCIDVGPVLYGDNIIVGQPYVNSFLISEKLEFSGVVITKSAFDFYQTACTGLKNLFASIELQVPFKTGYATAMCVNWLLPTERKAAEIMKCGIDDIEQLLYEKFSANGKVMGESALRKLSNTAITIRAFLAQNKSIDQK